MLRFSIHTRSITTSSNPPKSHVPHPHRSTNHLGHLLSHPNPAIRAKAATAIGKLHDPKFSSTLLTALTDESPLVRQALGQIGSPLAVSPLLTAIQNATDPIEMNSLIEALTSIGLNHPASIELIKNTTKNLINHSTDSQLRQSAIILLGRTALADSIPELITLLEAAVEALGNAVA
jgi:HEAT repeat protein